MRERLGVERVHADERLRHEREQEDRPEEERERVLADEAHCSAVREPDRPEVSERRGDEHEIDGEDGAHVGSFSAAQARLL